MKTLGRDESDSEYQSSGTKVIYFKLQGRKCRTDHSSRTKEKISPPKQVKDSMELQADAERKRRVQILASEGERDAATNKAEGEKSAAFLAAEGALARADATSKGLALVSKSLMETGGLEVAGLKVAEQYIDAFGNIAKQGTSTVFLPNDASSLSSMISQAITLYKKLGENPSTDIGFDKNRNSKKIVT